MPFQAYLTIWQRRIWGLEHKSLPLSLQPAKHVPTFYCSEDLLFIVWGDHPILLFDILPLNHYYLRLVFYPYVLQFFLWSFHFGFSIQLFQQTTTKERNFIMNDLLKLLRHYLRGLRSSFSCDCHVDWSNRSFYNLITRIY